MLHVLRCLCLDGGRTSVRGTLAPMNAETIFEDANASGHYIARRQKTGFQLRFDGKPAGGWEARNRHWYILNPFASRIDHHKTVLSRLGFEQQGGHRWWRLRGETNATAFRRAVEELTGVPFGPAE